MGPQGLPGEQGNRGIPGVNGPDGPMGMAGVNATLGFSNVELFGSCTPCRIVQELTSSSRVQNILTGNLPDVSVQKYKNVLI